MKTYIKADKFYYAYTVKPSGYLEISDGVFGNWSEQVDKKNAEIIDYTGYQIVPGLVDTHIHGYHSGDVMDNTEEALADMSKYLPEAGVTSFLATTLTDTHQNYLDVMQTIATFSGKETGAKIQGIYLEGPYFTEKYKGAQNPDYMRDPSWEEFQTWQEASNHMIKKIALAPERTGVEEFIERVTETGVVVALGHSNATYVEASSAVDTGASVWVHAYNGMREMTHRELGMVGSMYTVPNTIAELICDGFHVHPKAVEVLVKQKGHEHIALISDCMRAGGMPDGDYSLGEFPVYVKDGVARLKDSGNLAGSVLKLVDGVKNVINWGVVSPDEAIRMASLIPAQSSGIDQMCGQIKKGLAADFLVLDNQFELQATYINGEKKYQI